MMFTSGRLSSASEAYSVVDFPEPVGPVTSSAPVGRERMRESCARISSDSPSSSSVGATARLVEQAHRHCLAFDGRQRRDPDVEHTAGGGRVQGDASVLRLAPLGDVELREHLEAGRHAGDEALRDPLGDAQHPVDPEPHDQRVLLRLEVDVARALLGGLEDDRVDQPDERRLRDAVVDLEVVFLDLLDRGVGDGVLDERRVQRLRTRA